MSIEDNLEIASEIDSLETLPKTNTTGIIRAAMLISLGNILTRIFGLGRTAVLSSIAGTGAAAAIMYPIN